MDEIYSIRQTETRSEDESSLRRPISGLSLLVLVSDFPPPVPQSINLGYVALCDIFKYLNFQLQNI
ncbi:hypothetical protein HY500_02830 [Candidatus Woesearchaeota archaeon]|nr:hypothetical protein [Candidatus Woesearchaeota archaeon]